MAVSLVEPERLSSDTLDAVERVMMASRLSFERMGEEDLTGSLAGSWCDYQLWFAYRADLDVLHFASGFDMGVPDERRSAVCALINLINESLWVGHFDLWAEEGRPTWRHALLLRGTGRASKTSQIVDIVTVGVGECERFYPAFRQVIEAGPRARGRLRGRADGSVRVGLMTAISGDIVLVGGGRMGGALAAGWLRGPLQAAQLSHRRARRRRGPNALAPLGAACVARAFAALPGALQSLGNRLRRQAAGDGRGRATLFRHRRAGDCVHLSIAAGWPVRLAGARSRRRCRSSAPCRTRPPPSARA